MYTSNCEGIELKSYELSSFKSEKKDIDTLYDNESLTYYLSILLTKKVIDVEYNEKIGFVYISSDRTEELLKSLDSAYFKRVFVFINSLKQTRSIPFSTMNKYMKQILNEG